MRAAAAEANSQVAASQMMIKDRKVFILFIHLFIIHSLFNFWLVGFGLVGVSVGGVVQSGAAFFDRRGVGVGFLTGGGGAGGSGVCVAGAEHAFQIAAGFVATAGGVLLAVDGAELVGGEGFNAVDLDCQVVAFHYHFSAVGGHELEEVGQVDNLLAVLNLG